MVKITKTETLLERIARRRAELAEDEAEADRMVADDRTRAVREEVPSVRPLSEADVPPGILRAVTRPFHGLGAMVHDGGCVVDLNALPNGALLARSGFLGRPVHEKAVLAQGRLCTTCNPPQVYATEGEAVAHWRRMHGIVARSRAAEARQREEADRIAQTTPREGAATGARMEREWTQTRREALNPRPLHPGYPIPRPDVNDDGPEAA